MALPSRSSAPPPAAISRGLWAIIALMVVSVAINYIDRGSLGIAIPLLRKELHFSSQQIGWLSAAFFWTYALLQISSGWLVDRYEVKWVLALGFLAWSLATAATGLAHSIGFMVGCRLLLGIGESVAYPCYSKIIAARVQEHQRGRANGLIDAGTKFGPALGTLAGGLLMAHYGWRPVFVVLGLGGLLWLPAWLLWMPREPAAARVTMHTGGPGFGEILRQPRAWAAFLGHFSGNYFWYFLLTWLPDYLTKERHMSLETMAVVGAVAYCATGISTTITGCVADRAIAAGATPTRVRKTCVCGGLAVSSSVVGVAFIEDSTVAIALLLFACMAYGVFASSHWAIGQTMAGPAAVGKWSGLQNCVGNMAGVVAPAITGMVVQATDHFYWAFAVSAAVVLSGAAIYVFWLGPVEPVTWGTRETAR
jgi:ACS family D-galactonate transporter-like MFS transporter